MVVVCSVFAFIGGVGMGLIMMSLMIAASRDEEYTNGNKTESK